MWRLMAMLTVALTVCTSAATGSETDAAVIEAWVGRLENVRQATLHRYQLRDDGGRSMDCLQVVPLPSGRILGLYHARRQGRFGLHVAQSTNLLDWQHLGVLDDHASQGELHPLPGGAFLLAYEKDAPNSCWIRLRLYPDLESLRAGRPSEERDLARSLAPTAEGTPSFEAATVGPGGLAEADIRLRFHYFKNARVDRLARGHLRPGWNWEAAPSEDLNAQFEARGFQGNLGDRSRFEWAGRTFYLQEVQEIPQQWDTWRIYLCDRSGKPLRPVAFQTHGGSRAFCNPNVVRLPRPNRPDQMVVSLFLPSEGNAPGEAGSLIFAFETPATTTQAKP